MNYRQSWEPVSAAKALYYITLGSARLLGLDSEIGSLETGKEADIVFIEPAEDFLVDDNIISKLVFCESDFTITHTLVGGKEL